MSSGPFSIGWQSRRGRCSSPWLYNYYLGGKDNYVADRDAASMVLHLAPEIRATARRRAEKLTSGEGGDGEGEERFIEQGA